MMQAWQPLLFSNGHGWAAERLSASATMQLTPDLLSWQIICSDEERVLGAWLHLFMEGMILKVGSNWAWKLRLLQLRALL